MPGTKQVQGKMISQHNKRLGARMNSPCVLELSFFHFIPLSDLHMSST